MFTVLIALGIMVNYLLLRNRVKELEYRIVALEHMIEDVVYTEESDGEAI